MAAGSFGWAIKIAGGLYLLWLSYKSFRSAASPHDIEATTLSGSTRTPFGYAVRGFAIISLGLREHAPLWVAFAIVVGTWILSVIIHWLYAVAFSTRVMVRAYSRARRWIQGAPGAVFAVADVKLLTSRT